MNRDLMLVDMVFVSAMGRNMGAVLIDVSDWDGLMEVRVSDGVVAKLSNLMDGFMMVFLLMNGSVVLTLVVSSTVDIIMMAALVNGLMMRLINVTIVVTIVFTLTPVVLSAGNSADGSECK